MPAPAINDNESDRLASLDSFALTREREARYQELAELASFVAHTPIASLSVVGADEVWFKAAIGLDPDDALARPDSLCGHTVAEARPVISPDTLLDDRFADNPLVTGPPRIRFYAGVPLMVDAELPIGTLCVMDTRPRTFLTDERRALQIIANQAMTQLRTDRLARLVGE